MTPDELRSLADEATQRPQDDMEMARYYAAQKALIALAPDLARLCAEMGEALETAYDQIDMLLAIPPSLDEKVDRDALAKLSELKP